MLIEPGIEEKYLNKKKTNLRKKINLEKEIQFAEKAFEENNFFILVDDKQYEHLNDKVILEEDSKISFIKLIPLVGG